MHTYHKHLGRQNRPSSHLCGSLQTVLLITSMSAHDHHTSHASLQIVLLGDAAHTMSPVLGQGLNAGLEDVAVFADCLQQHLGNVDTALPAYNTRRLPDVQAIMTVNEVVASSDIGLSVQVQCACPSSLPCTLAFQRKVALPSCPSCLPRLPFLFSEFLARRTCPSSLPCMLALPLPVSLPACRSACLPVCLSACLCPCLLA